MDYSSSSPYEKGLYLSSMKPILNKRALFSDPSDEYVIPMEPNPYGLIKIRFRTAKNNVDHVFMICNNNRVMMQKYQTINTFDYYECEYQLDNDRISYHFEVVAGRVFGDKVEILSVTFLKNCCIISV